METAGHQQRTDKALFSCRPQCSGCICVCKPRWLSLLSANSESSLFQLLKMLICPINPESKFCLHCEPVQDYDAAKPHVSLSHVTNSLLSVLFILKESTRLEYLCWQVPTALSAAPRWTPFTLSSLWDVNSAILPLFPSPETVFYCNGLPRQHAETPWTMSPMTGSTDVPAAAV